LICAIFDKSLKQIPIEAVRGSVGIYFLYDQLSSFMMRVAPRTTMI